MSCFCTSSVLGVLGVSNGFDDGTSMGLTIGVGLVTSSSDCELKGALLGR